MSSKRPESGSFEARDLLRRLVLLETKASPAARYVIALSGGLDSTVLAHALATTREQHGKPLLAVHVDHGLHPDSAAWSDHCRQFAAALGLDFESMAIDVPRDHRGGLEAAARETRYRALADVVRAGDWLLCAHHRDDQAETLLLNLLRGSGPAGIAAMPAVRRFESGWLARPLLDSDRAALAVYAGRANLSWIDDPGNDDSQFDRNFLRQELLPVVAGRWPDASRRLARSAELAREASTLLDVLADSDLQPLLAGEGRVSVSGLQKLDLSRQRNAIRRAAVRAGVPRPGARSLQQIVATLLPARADASPCVSWAGGDARRYRDVLVLMPTLAESFEEQTWHGRSALELGAGLGRLRCEPGVVGGLDPALVEAGLRLRRRRGGETIKPVDHMHTRKVKKLLQEEGVLPWMRDRLPLLYAGERLVAVADFWVDAAAACANGTRIRWEDRPPLF